MPQRENLDDGRAVIFLMNLVVQVHPDAREIYATKSGKGWVGLPKASFGLSSYELEDSQELFEYCIRRFAAIDLPPVGSLLDLVSGSLGYRQRE